MFSPNGIVPKAFWPDEEGEKFTLKESLSLLAALSGPHAPDPPGSATRFGATVIATCEGWAAS